MTGEERGRVWAEARRLLCIRLDTIGDVLMTTPALRALKEARPGRRITLLTSAPGAEIAALVPEVDDVIVYRAPWMKADAASDPGVDLAMVERLRRLAFDGAVVFNVYSQNPLAAVFLSYLAGVPLRLAHCREKPYRLLTDWVPDPEPGSGIRHEVRRQLDLVAAVGCTTTNEDLSLSVPAAARRGIDAVLRAHGLEVGRPFIVVHPGATAPSRRYPPESFAAAADLLGTESHRLLFTGSAAERDLVAGIVGRMQSPATSLAGVLGLAELCALIERTTLLISNNTGPVHIAAALGIPVVDLYALTNPQHTPWGVPSRVLFHDVPCRLCEASVCPEGHHHCLTLVTPEQVAEAARALLGDRFAPRATG